MEVLPAPPPGDPGRMSRLPSGVPGRSFPLDAAGAVPWNGMDLEKAVESAALADPNAPLCSHCNGYGSSLKEEEERCSVCGGTGLVVPSEN